MQWRNVEARNLRSGYVSVSSGKWLELENVVQFGIVGAGALGTSLSKRKSTACDAVQLSCPRGLAKLTEAADGHARLGE